MRVAMYYNNQDVRLEEMPVPQIGPQELLVRIEASGICGSDVMEWYRIHKAPLVLGHELAGEVVEAGEEVDRFKKGDRVVIAHHVPCNTCYYCLNGHPNVCNTLRQTKLDPGGFAEYIRVPAINADRGVFLLPDEVSFEEATFTEPVACVIHAQKMLRTQPGYTMLVIGSGIAGLIHIQLARVLGAGCIIATDINDYRLKAAKHLSADLVINANEDVEANLRRINNGRLADVVVVCTGSVPAITQAFHLVERGGTVLLFAPTEPGESIPLSINDIFWGNEITVTTSYAGNPADHLMALQLIHTHRILVREMITHRLGLAETGLGFKLVANARDSIKVIIECQR